MSKGKILILSGPSGVGKGTVSKVVLSKGTNIVLSVSATTRNPREGETDTVDYFFITKEQFEEKIKNDEMLEYNCYNGNYYGTMKSVVEDNQDNGRDVLLEIDVNGAEQVKKKCDNAITVFLTAPSVEEVEKRLRGRHSESEEAIQKRLEIAKAEMKLADKYDYVVCNDDVDKAADRIIDILRETK